MRKTNIILASIASCALAGCSTVDWKSDFDDLASAKPIKVNSQSLIKKEGFQSFHAGNVVTYKLKKQGASYSFISDGSAFDWGPGGVAVLRSGQAHPIHAPKTMKWIGENAAEILVPVSGRDIRIYVTLKPYDISGLSIASFLRTPGNLMHKDGYTLGSEYRFPAGSIGYQPILTIKSDEIFLQSKTRFTGSSTLTQFTNRFSKDTPYCLKFLPRKEALPFGFTFDKDINNSNSGTLYLRKAKKGTLFCKKTDESYFDKGKWELSSINGTQIMNLTFPKSIVPQNYGVPPEQYGAITMGFAESANKVLPVYIWHKNSPIPDAKWRFNLKAGEAIKKALEDLPQKKKELEKRKSK